MVRWHNKRQNYNLVWLWINKETQERHVDPRMWIHYIEWWKWKYCFFSVHVSHKQEFLLAAFWYLSQISRSSSNERCELTILGYQLGNITNCQENFQVIRDSELTYKGWDIFSRYLRYVFMILKIISIKSIEKNSYFVSCYKNRRH